MKRNRSIVVVVAAALMATLSGVLPVSAATTPPRPTESARDGVLAAEPSVGAEVIDMRTETSKTFRGDVDGQFVTRVGAGLLHFKDGGGEWAEIDTELADPVRGRRATKSTPVPVDVATDATDPSLVRVQAAPGVEVGFGLAGAGRGVAGTDPNQAVLGGVLPGVDIKVRPLRNGAATDLVLAGPSVPAEYVFPLKLKGVTATVEGDGTVTYRDAKGAVRAATPKGHMFDSNVDQRSGDAARSDGVVYSLVDLPGGVRALKVSLDKTWLDDKARQYPVTVDPDVVVAGIDDTYNQSPYTNNYSGEAEVKVGSFNGGANKSRAFFHFNLAPYAGKVINQASVYAVETHSYSCQARPMSLYRVTSDWSTINTFPGPALGERVGGANFAAGYSSACPVQWAAFDVTGAVRNWTNGTWANRGVAFVADNEGDSYGWKKFCSANGGGASCPANTYPHIQVTWSNPITVPTCAPTGPSAVANPGGTVTVNWTPVPNTPACNGGSGITGYYVDWGDSTGLLGYQFCNGAGCNTSTVHGLALNHAYYFTIYTTNAVGFNPNPATTNWVTVISKPGVPASVAANAGNGSAYVWWTPPLNTGSHPIDTYTAIVTDVATGGYVGHQACQVPCSAMTLSLLGMSNGRTYRVDVGAHNQIGQGGITSASNVTLTPTPVPNPVIAATAWAGDAAGYLRWNPPVPNGGAPVDQYVMAAFYPDGSQVGGPNAGGACNVSGPTSPCPALDWVWNGTNNPGLGLLNGTAYRWIVFAHNPAGYGTATGLTNPATPSTTSLFPPRSAQVTAGNGDAVITWTPPAPPTGPGGSAPHSQYMIHRWDMSGPAPVYVDYKQVTGDQTAVHWPGLTNGTAYSFPVFTQSANGFSALPTTPGTVTPLASIGDLLGDLLTPTMVTATRGDQKLTVAWRRPIIAIEGLTTYTITATPSADQPQPPVAPKTVTTPPLTGGPTYTFDIGGLRNGTSYTVRVRAVNLILPGPFSDPSAPVTPAGRPFPPVDAAGVRGDQSVTLTWQPPPDRPDGVPGNNGDPIVRYDVQVLDPTGTVIDTRQGVTSGQAVGQLTNGTPYRFRILATNGVGTSDPSQPTAVIIPAGRPFPPTGVVAEAGIGNVRVSWTAADGNGDPVSRYTVTARPDNGPAKSAQTTATAVTMSGFTDGQGYTFTVTATNGVGTSDPSAPSNRVVPIGPPDPPQNLRAVPGDHKITVTWNFGATNGTPITGHTVTVIPLGGGTPIVRAVDATTSSVTVELPDNGIYSVSVVAESAAGPSMPASTNAVPGPPPPPPGFVVPSAGPSLVAEQEAMLMVRAAAGTQVGFSVITGPNTGATGRCWDGAGACVTNSDGSVYWTYTSGPNPGDDAIEVYMDTNANGVRDTGEAAGNTTQTWYRYVAIGDSYSSGEGITPFYPGTDTATNGCHRSPKSHPVLRGGKPGGTADPHNGTGFTFLSCANARIENVEPGGSSQFGEQAQLDANPGVNTQTGLVTISVGGNNMRFSDILKHCASNVDCLQDPFDNRPTLEAWLQENSDALFDDLRGLYLLTKQEASPNTAIIVTGYPHLFADAEDEQHCDKLAPGDGPLGIAPDERYALNGWVDVVDDKIAAAAAAAGVWYVDLRAAFDGHEVCGDSGEWINGLTNPCQPTISPPFIECDGIVGSGSFHPKPEGQIAYHNTISRFIDDRLAGGSPRTPAGLPANPPTP